MKTFVAFAGLSICLLLAAGCASTPQRTAPLTKEQILLHPDLKYKMPVVFRNGVGDVRLAGLRSLTYVGCEVKIQEPLYLSGRRPARLGLFAGGETVKIFLYPQSEAETHVWVDTDKSFAGLGGGHEWDQEVIEEMTRVLNKSVAGP